MVSYRSENINFGANAQSVVNCLKVLIIESYTAMSHRHSQESFVKCSMNKISVTDAHGIITKHSVFIS